MSIKPSQAKPSQLNHNFYISSLDIPIFTKLYDLYKNLTQAITTFPKNKTLHSWAKIRQSDIRDI